ncbi:hypothetical protein NUW54_g13064 [Trametes sanguinea]|uniref:Uncharacterized protein n=1 Tax=Trametes sanguinea TaxID=158606 RepID=A0ACC1MQW3_9APHY|nr:hypothetical protein NUW54_g13064 [Trametes sanguinea]
MMAMFVQAFWFGAKLVRDGSISPGTVMSVFWACLIATSNLQMCIPQLIVLTKGKFAMVALLTLAQSQSSEPVPYGTNMLSPIAKSRRPSMFRKIRPTHCRGHFEFCDVTFAYPSRPTMPVLQDISIFLPPGETSFIVGGSGSGKSTLAQLLLRMYTPRSGSIILDDQMLVVVYRPKDQEHGECGVPSGSGSARSPRRGDRCLGLGRSHHDHLEQEEQRPASLRSAMRT